MALAPRPAPPRPPVLAASVALTVRRQLRRLLVVLGVVHVLDAVAWSLLWRYRRSWARALGRAVLDELQRR